jgi:hypothetical protein
MIRSSLSIIFLELESRVSWKKLKNLSLRPKPAPKGRTMTVSELTEGLGLIETCYKVFED